MIAIVYAEFYGVGGIARYLDGFLSNLPADHPGVIVICGDAERMPRRYPKVKLIHLPFSPNRVGKATWGWRAGRLLRQLYRSGTISAVNLHLPPLIPGLLIPREIPLILTAHTTYLGMSGRFYMERYFSSQWNAGSILLKLIMEKAILSRTAKVIALTEQGSQEVRRYRYTGNIEVVPNGVDLDRFVPEPAVAKDIDVLFSGRIERRKGSRAMVEVCRRLVEERPQIRIFIAGFGEDAQYVADQLAAYSNVFLVGKVAFDDMVVYYRRSRLYASTSYYEGLPCTCLEAMAMEMPVVAWDLPFYRQLAVDGETSLLAPPNDYHGMVARILAMLGDPATASRLGKQARQRLADRYDWAHLASALVRSLALPSPPALRYPEPGAAP